MNVKLQTFVPYSDKFFGVGWRTVKVGDKKLPVFLESYAQKKKGGKAAPKGLGQASRSVDPDMTLTGRTLDDLNVLGQDKKSFTFGWMGIAAGRVRNLFEMKNYQIVNLGSGEPLSRLENDLVHRAYEEDYNKKIDEYEYDPINFKLEF